MSTNRAFKLNVKDPAAQLAAFNADLARMAEGQKPKDPTAAKQKMPSKRFQQAPIARGEVFCATLPDNLSYEDVLRPGFFSLQAHLLGRGTKIEVRNDKLTFYAELIVVGWDLASASVEVRELSYKDLAPATLSLEAASAGFRIEDRGLTEQFCVLRDDHLLKSGLRTKNEALHYIQTEAMARVVGRPL